MVKKELSIRDFSSVGIFIAIIAVLAQVTIPLPYVPMTLQTLAVPLAGIVMGPRKGTLAAVGYVLLGAVGVPVFAGFSSGMGMVFGATGGFLLSFPLMAFTAGIGAANGNKRWLAFWLAAGAVLNYLCGMFMFAFVMSSDLRTAFATCVLPFIPTAVIKIVIAYLFGPKLKNMLIKAGVMI